MSVLISILCRDELCVVSTCLCVFTHSLKCYSFTDTVTSSSKPEYLVVAISVTVVVVVMVAIVVGIIYCLRVRRKHSQRHKEQASSQVEMKAKEEFI